MLCRCLNMHLQQTDSPPTVDRLEGRTEEKLHDAIRDQVPDVRVDPHVRNVTPELVVEVLAAGEGADALQPHYFGTADLVEGGVLEAGLTVRRVNPDDIHYDLRECRDDNEVRENSGFVEIIWVLEGGTEKQGGLRRAITCVRTCCVVSEHALTS